MLDYIISAKSEFQSTHPVRGATETKDLTNTSQIISIHAPREGCDKIPGRSITK